VFITTDNKGSKSNAMIRKVPDCIDMNLNV